VGYEHALRTLKATKNGDGAGIAEFQDDFRQMAARGAASTVLALAENLPKIVDKSAVTEAQDSRVTPFAASLVILSAQKSRSGRCNPIRSDSYAGE
jgi:hypothetical protein